MKKIFIFLAWTIFVVQLPTAVFATPSISFDSPAIGYLGNPFTIDIYATPDVGEEITGFGFDVFFSPGEFDFGGATVGASFWTDPVIPVAADVWGMAFPASDTVVLLASLVFTPRVTGNLSLGIFSDIGTDPFTGFPNNPNHGLFYFNSDMPEDMTTLLQLEVRAGQPVPEPSSLLLLGCGLAALGFVTIKRRKA